MSMNKRLLRWLVLLVVLAGIALAVVYREAFDAATLQRWVDEAGPLGPLLFILVYVLATVLFLPGAVITLVGGALFGPIWGTFYNLTGATLGATLAFLVARYLAADWAERHAGGRLGRLKTGVEAEGWRFVAFVRLVPLFPFNALNYALGLTRIPLGAYVATSYLAMLPGALAYTYLGYVGREAAGGSEDLAGKLLMALALLAAVSFLPGLIGRLRQGPMLTVSELNTRLEGRGPLLLLDVRSAEEFNGELGHIPEAVNIPLETLSKRLPDLEAYREQPVAIVCHTDRRSAKAAALLSKQGFADLHVVRQGMTGWRQAGLAVARD